MNSYLVLYNPYAQQGHGLENAKKLEQCYPSAEIRCEDMTKIADYAGFFASVPEDVKIVFTGGDGTLNRVANALYGYELPRDLYYFGAGSGNDFLKDIGKEAGGEPFVVNDYIKDLPLITVNGEHYRFLNGVGCGIDGYCCEESNRLHALGKAKTYSMIAFEGVLGKYRTRNAKVTVDGVTKTYKKVWMVPVMHGSFYGGGFNMAPKQNRNNADHTVTAITAHGVSRFLATFLFLLVKKGFGEKFTKYMNYQVGHHVEVEFDEPVALQVDGETITGVTKYTVDYST